MAEPHKVDLDMSKRNPDDALVALYAVLAARNAPKPGSFSALDADQRREYFRVARQRSRARVRVSAAAGSLEPNDANVRAALADAALMLLATDGPGAEQVRQVLTIVFAGRPGVPLSVEQRARAGKLRTKLVGRG